MLIGDKNCGVCGGGCNSINNLRNVCKFNASAAFAATLSRGFILVTIVKHSVGDASSVSVSSHVLHNTHYVVSAHLKSILIDISETRLMNYARCYVVLWLITYLRKK